MIDTFFWCTGLAVWALIGVACVSMFVAKSMIGPSRAEMRHLSLLAAFLGVTDCLQGGGMNLCPARRLARIRYIPVRRLYPCECRQTRNNWRQPL
jgi:hypothetical protein